LIDNFSTFCRRSLSLSFYNSGERTRAGVVVSSGFPSKEKPSSKNNNNNPILAVVQNPNIPVPVQPC